MSVATLNKRLLLTHEIYELMIQEGEIGVWEWPDLNVDQLNWSETMMDIFEMDHGTQPKFSDYADALHPDDKERVVDLVQNHLKTGTSANAEYRIITKKGNLKWLRSFRTCQRDEEGTPVSMVGYCLDISEMMKGVHTIMGLNEKLEQSNQDLEHFASCASHDLQEPLRKVRSFSDRIRHRATDLDERSMDYFERMESAVVRMQKLITDLLDFSRIRKSAEPSAETDLNEVVSQVISDVESLLQDTQGQIKIEGSLPQVQGKMPQLYRLFLNLISNGLKFHKPDMPPVVTIRATEVNQEDAKALGFEKANEPKYHCIEVADNGIGFEEEYAEQIFNMFQRIHARSEYEGTGIGLSMCRRIIEKHNGYITAEGHAGKGAKFFVVFPVM